MPWFPFGFGRDSDSLRSAVLLRRAASVREFGSVAPADSGRRFAPFLEPHGPCGPSDCDPVAEEGVAHTGLFWLFFLSLSLSLSFCLPVFMFTFVKEKRSKIFALVVCKRHVSSMNMYLPFLS